MVELNLEQRQKVWPLVEGWDETIIWTGLQGHWGSVWADDAENPRSARVVVGDFVFYAGEPNLELVKSTEGFFRESILTPQHAGWAAMIEEVWGSVTEKLDRVAIKKEPDVFDREHLEQLAAALPAEYEMRMMDADLVEQALSEPWSWHLCGQYAGVEDFLRRGIGVGVTYNGKMVAGASSYSVYDTGIEVEIDTNEEHRGKGIATACGAKLILACLDRGLYPSWDAANARSVHLAEKLGYHAAEPYDSWFLKLENA